MIELCRLAVSLTLDSSTDEILRLTNLLPIRTFQVHSCHSTDVELFQFVGYAASLRIYSLHPRSFSSALLHL